MYIAHSDIATCCCELPGVSVREKGSIQRCMHHVYSMCMLGVCVCVQLARSPRLVGLGVAEGHGSVHPSAAAGHKD